MRVSFDFVVSGFTVGCSVSRDNMSFARLSGLPPGSPPPRTVVLISMLCIVATYLLHRIYQLRKHATVAYSVPIPLQVQSGWKGEQHSSTNIRSSTSLDIQCYSPATGEFLGAVPASTPADIDRAISNAGSAQKNWSRTTFAQRKQVLRTMRQYILNHQDEIARAACLDSGKTMVDAGFGEVLVTAEKISWTLSHAESALKPELRRASFPLMCYKKVSVRYEPMGVVAACVSWNYPFHNLLNPIITALFAGNAIIVKGSEMTAWSARYYISIVRGSLQACGHDPELVQSISCFPEIAPHFTSHPGLAHLTFIGSRAVALHVAASASKSLTPLILELGGKDPSILLPHQHNLASTVSILLRGVFQSAGQNCIGIERVIACEPTYSRILPSLQSRIQSLKPGPSGDVGAMISSVRFSSLEDLISEAVSQGAQLLAGGKRYNHPDYPSGTYFEPTLLANVNKSMRIAQEELFAPVMLLFPAESVTDAIDIANSTEYSLGASVFGHVGYHAADIETVLRKVRCGMIAVNDFASFYLNQDAPFGGVGGSGYGRFGGIEGLRGVCTVKTVCEDRFGRWGMRTKIPPLVDLPAPEKDTACVDGGRGGRGWEFVKGLTLLGYGGAAGKVNGLRALIGL